MILDELHMQNVKKNRSHSIEALPKVSFGNEFHLSFGVIYYIKNKERMYNWNKSTGLTKLEKLCQLLEKQKKRQP